VLFAVAVNAVLALVRAIVAQPVVLWDVFGRREPSSGASIPPVLSVLDRERLFSV